MISNKTVVQLLFVINAICTISVLTIQYTVQEKAAIEKFRASIPDIITEDDYYRKDHFSMRWLRARNMDVSSATAMIRKAHKWRKDNRIDSILNETDLLHFTPPPYTIQGKDKEGHPILLLTPTSIDLRLLLLTGKREKAIRTFDQMLEKLYQNVKNLTKHGELMKNGEEITQVVGILDAHGFNPRQHMCIPCIEFFIEIIQHFQDYYPEALKHFVFINVYRIAAPVSNLVRPFMLKEFRKSVKAFGPNKAEWGKFLRSIIDEDQLPFRFGGKSKKSAK